MCVAHRDALTQITRLTVSSAGWESELLRLLHYNGSTIEHLSLWETESRALLRDAAQVKGRTAQAAWAVGEHLFDEDGDGERAQEDAELPSAVSVSAPDEDDLPHWLRAELAHAPAEAVARQHIAHFPLVPRSTTTGPWRRRRRPRACTPRFLSIVLAYPFFENERPELFAHMLIWSRVEELDVYMPMEPLKSLFLLAQLGPTTSTWRLRISSAHATLAIETSARGALGNACAVLAELVHHRHLREALLHEFRGRSLSDARVLEDACLRSLESSEAVRLRVTQGNQAVWGKLRHRLWDFRERAQWGRDGAWAQLL